MTIIITDPTTEQLAQHLYKVEAMKAARTGTATAEQQIFLAGVIGDLELCIDTILNRVEFLKSLVTKE